jgi:hypothetical protein
MRRKGRKLSIVLFLIAVLTAASVIFAQDRSRTFENVWGPKYRAAARTAERERQVFQHGSNSLNRLRRWNGVAIDASGLDHTPVAPGENRVFGEQVGPGRASRAIAIFHIAIFDAISAIDHRYESYTNLPRVFVNTSVDSAIAQAAHDTLVALFPSQAPSFDQELAEDLNDIPGGIAKLRGIELGRRSAARILALRANDNSQHAEPSASSGDDQLRLSPCFQ